MKRNDIYIIGIADGNPDKLGQHVNISDSTYEIKYIGDFEEDSYDYILITSEQHFEDRRKFLMSQGICGDIVITVEYFIDSIINKTSECNYGISVAAIVKDEVEYIEEWIQFHILMGIEHFYIYDNESSDGTTEILKEYEKIGLITYTFWPGEAQQAAVYSNAIDRFKNNSIYIAFIDADEFLFSVTENKIMDELNQILAQYKKSRYPAYERKPAAIGVNWRTYGTSFYSNKSDGLVIRRFVFRQRANEGLNAHIKSICNPRAVVRMSIHNAEFVPGYCCISENGSEIPGPFFRDGRCQRLRINHYISKSEEEYVKRKKKGDACGDKSTQSEEHIRNAIKYYQTECNEYYDSILIKYSNLVENAIKKCQDKYI